LLRYNIKPVVNKMCFFFSQCSFWLVSMRMSFVVAIQGLWNRTSHWISRGYDRLELHTSLQLKSENTTLCNFPWYIWRKKNTI